MARTVEASASYGVLAKHIKKVANWQVRNVGSWAGNLVMARIRAGHVAILHEDFLLLEPGFSL